jgi:hypothetical protein
MFDVQFFPSNFENFCCFTFFLGFSLLTFLGAFLKAGINEFDISITFSFFDTHIDIFHENFFGVLIALFANFKCKC